MGILGKEAADVLAKQASEGVPMDDHEKWMSGGGIRKWAKQRKRSYVEKDRLGGDRRAVIERAMKWVRMEESGRVDDEGRPILERVDLLEAFFAGVHRQI